MVAYYNTELERGGRAAHVPLRRLVFWMQLTSRLDRHGLDSADAREKVATFYSQTCMRYVLECLYGTVFARTYEQSRRHKSLAEAL